MFVFDRDPSAYRHWKLSFAGPVATLALDVDEAGGLVPGYALKLNSYDLGVDMELHDALQRIRFEHPEVKSVVLTSAKERMFCAGANIYMLGFSSHAWKVNFCKFTNETRNSIEDSSRHSGLKFLAAVNGACAGGGYEMALACDEILMVDDRSTLVSLPEVPLLGVLPGTGGLTRLVDKRRVRRDLADLFCTNADGVRADRAKAWRLVDDTAPPSEFAAKVRARALELAAQSDRPDDAKGIALTPLNRRIADGRIDYDWVEVEIDAANRVATLTVKAPEAAPASAIVEIVATGDAWWPLAMARQLDDAILMLRLNALEIGLWVLKTRGDAETVIAADAALAANADHWLVRETIGLLRRTLARLDVSSRSLYAVVDEGSCFAGTLAEILLAADRSFMLDMSAADESNARPEIRLSPLNFGTYPMVSGRTRLASRFNDDAVAEVLRGRIGAGMDATAASAVGLVTETPDELDWDDELRLAIEERASLSPDALTGLEASLRFAGAETLETKIFGRLSAWQNWIFNRPNAVGEKGALKLFGTGSKAAFNWERV
ncbi:MAG: h16 [Rhodospirillales bacterium]|nr:h16 [Rhodospirillales bacterium]